MASLSTSNSAMTLVVRGLFPTPQNIEGYSADDSFSTDDVTPSERVMGVDGKFSAGYVPYPTKLTLTLQADSPSIDMFDAVLAAQVAAKELYIFDGVVIIPGIAKKYVFTKGYLAEMTPMSSGKKILQPRKFAIEFESQTPSPI